MKKRLYIHIGAHRTGTTAIQSMLARNRGALATAGLDYVNYCLLGTSHSPLALCLPSLRHAMVSQLRGRNHTFDDSMYIAYSGPPASKIYTGFVDYIRKVKSPKLLISSECFSEWLDPADLAAHLSYQGLEIQILLSIRRQDRWIESIYSQVVKDQGLRYSESLEGLPQWGMLDYLSQVDAWASAFGRHAIKLGFYQEQEPLSALFDKFFQLMDMPHATDSLETSFVTENNASLDVECTNVLARINALEDLSPALGNQIVESLKSISKEFREMGIAQVWRIDDEQSSRVVERYVNSNRLLAVKYGASLGEAWGEVIEPDASIYREQKLARIGEEIEPLLAREGQRLEGFLSC